MDLRINVFDENGRIMYVRSLHKDGSDSLAAERIADAIDLEFGAPTSDEEDDVCTPTIKRR